MITASIAPRQSTGARRIGLVVTLAVGGLLASAAGFTAQGDEAGTTVEITDFTFSPARIEIKAGTSVTWINRDQSPHTVISTTKLFQSAPLDTGDSATIAFPNPGTYPYFCSLHPRMTGTVEAR